MALLVEQTVAQGVDSTRLEQGLSLVHFSRGTTLGTPLSPVEEDEDDEEKLRRR